MEENKPKASRVLYGSICLDDIPAEAIAQIASSGRDLYGNSIMKKYVNVALYVKGQPDMYGNTHFLKCDVRKENRVENKNYIIGNMRPSEYRDHVTPEQVDAACAMMSQESHEVQ